MLIPSFSSSHIQIPKRGGLAQLGERDVRNVEVGGSIPLPSTMCSSGKIEKHPQVTGRNG